ncbi:MAG: formyltransferase family protein [Rickettsiales bacterium]|nr:formyltransferase family protein [Rickettsiales bacterium]
MKIGIATSGDFISNFLINEIHLAFPNDEIAILIDENVGKADSDFIRDIVYYEHTLVNEIFYPFVERLNVKQKYLTYNQLGNLKNIELFRFININTQENLIKELNLDIIISVRFRTIFKDNIISISKYGIYNIHSGILPKYRGAYCLIRAINNGEKYIGCSLHKIDLSEDIDAGDVFAVSKILIDFNGSYVFNNINMFNNITPIVLDFLKKIKNGNKINLIKQEGKFFYYGYPTKEDTRKFRTKIKNIITPEDVKYIFNKYI